MLKVRDRAYQPRTGDRHWAKYSAVKVQAAGRREASDEEAEAQESWITAGRLPPPSEFAASPAGLGLGEALFPGVAEALDEFLGRPYQEGVLRWGIGAGKGFCASVFLAWTLAWVVQEMKDGVFYRRFSLARGSEITLAAFGPQPSVYEDCYRMVQEAPWFALRAPLDASLSSEVRLLRDPARPATRANRWPVVVESHTPGSKKSLGINAFAVVVDEVNFWLETEGKSGDQAQEKYNELDRRIRSRFGRFGKALFISSARYNADFGNRKLEEAAREPERVFASVRATWEVKPLDRFPESNGQTFDWADEADAGRRLSGIPLEFQTAFRNNPLLAARDYGSLTTAAAMPWDAAAERYMGVENYAGHADPPPPEGRGPDPLLESPWVELEPGDEVAWEWPWKLAEWFRPGGRDWLPTASQPVALHFDLAISPDLGSDALGMAMAHWVPTGDRDDPAAAVVDMAHRVTADDVQGERCVEDTRALVRALDKRGFKVGLVTYDGFQSADSIQQLRRMRYPADTYSVDKTLEAYTELKSALLSRRCRYGAGFWQQEYAHLEFIKGVKVDHQAAGPVRSKDVADAVAEVVACVRRWGRQQLTTASPEREAGVLSEYSEADRERIARGERHEQERQERWDRRQEEREKAQADRHPRV